MGNRMRRSWQTRMEEIGQPQCVKSLAKKELLTFSEQTNKYSEKGEKKWDACVEEKKKGEGEETHNKPWLVTRGVGGEEEGGHPEFVPIHNGEEEEEEEEEEGKEGEGINQ